MTSNGMCEDCGFALDPALDGQCARCNSLPAVSPGTGAPSTSHGLELQLDAPTMDAATLELELAPRGGPLGDFPVHEEQSREPVSLPRPTSEGARRASLTAVRPATRPLAPREEPGFARHFLSPADGMLRPWVGAVLVAACLASIVAGRIANERAYALHDADEVSGP